MTVKELREALAALPDDLIVVCPEGYQVPIEVTEVTVAHEGSFLGEHRWLGGPFVRLE